MKYKKMMLLSMVIAFVTAFILPKMEEGYGLPLAWIIYHGEKSIANAIQLFHFSNFSSTSFDLAILLVNSFIIYFILLILFKVLNKVNADFQ